MRETFESWLVKEDEAARILGLPENTVVRLRLRGALPFVRAGKRMIRYERAELVRLAPQFAVHYRDRTGPFAVNLTDPQQLDHVGRELRRLRAENRTLRKQLRFSVPEFPAVPSHTVTPTRHGDQLPFRPGIYFVWRGEEVSVVYVGQAVRLNMRARVGHERIEKGDLISWLECPIHLLDLWESYYICALRPLLNRTKGAIRPSTGPTRAELRHVASDL